MQDNKIVRNMMKIVRRGATLISPKLNTRLCFYFKFRRNVNLKNPVTLNEKILWYKYNVYWNNPLIKQCADKYLVREYIADKGFEDILIPLVATYDSVDDIKWNELPNQFAMKWNFGYGLNVICTDKSHLDVNQASRQMKKWKNRKLWLDYAEMQYKVDRKRIVIEECLPITDGKLPEDYKFYCMNGKCKLVMSCTDRVIGSGAQYAFYDKDWNIISAEETPKAQDKPLLYDKALSYAEELANDFPFVRVDLYIENSKIYFGELTFTPTAGMDIDFNFIPYGRNETLDIIFGRELKLEIPEAFKK